MTPLHEQFPDELLDEMLAAFWRHWRELIAANGQVVHTPPYELLPPGLQAAQRECMRKAIGVIERHTMQ